MKNLIIFGTILSACTGSFASACMCSNYPLDPQDAIVQAAKIAAHGGRSTKIDPEKDIEVIRAYPTRAERRNKYDFKGTSCEIFGPNGESLFYCSEVTRADYKVQVTTYKRKCDVAVYAEATLNSIWAKAKSTTCQEN